jgi:hypothetical protein
MTNVKIISLVMLLAASAPAADPVFDRQIRPLLVSSCAPCHDGKTRSSGLSVETADNLLQGGARRGAAIAPGNPQDSVIVKMLRGELAPRMPLGKDPLPAGQIDLIADWIKGLKADTAAKASRWWAFEPPKSGARGGIDELVRSKLEEKGLSPSPEAPKPMLLRRAFFDLVGEPPTPTETRAFLSDTSTGAYEKLVDRLLADPRYGERWGRHWLDLARYADTQGFEQDRENYHMWRYRDYVIDAFNRDKPYDLFIKEQLAADEMTSGAETGLDGFMGQAKGKAREDLAALGFLRMAPRFQTTIAQESRQLMLDEITATVGSVFLGLSVKCAQCHDHKYDPIPQKDYYRMQAFFAPMEVEDAASDFSDSGLKVRLASATVEAEKRLKAAEQVFDSFQAAMLEKLDDAKKAGTNDKCGEYKMLGLNVVDFGWASRKNKPAIYDLEPHIYRVDAGAITPSEEDTVFTPEERQKYLDLLNVVADTRVEKGLIPRQMARYEAKIHAVKNAVNDANKPALPVTLVRILGEYNRYGDAVEPGFLRAISGSAEPVQLPTDLFGNPVKYRLPLANWIASADNPLTARVMANRIWQHHFGTGLVATSSDFGRNGTLPTNPELLDWLARQLVEKKWSVKAMQRLIMTSATYRQTSVATSKKAEEIDPDNRMFWRMNRTRLEGEIIRDSMLAVSGRLNPERGGPGIFPRLPRAMADRMRNKGVPVWEPSDGPESRKRSVYIFQRRNLEVPFFTVMDASVFQTTCERRAVSTTALQALTLLDNELVNEEAQDFAKRVGAEMGPDPSEQIRYAFELALARAPKPEEFADARKFLASEGADGLAGLCRVLFNMNEFVYVD